MAATIRGRVVSHGMAAGSKSERHALFLRTADGMEYVLRRIGAHPFRDQDLSKLENHRIEVVGEIRGTTLLAHEVHELDG
ncbi:MAG: hypothetical protein JNK49_10250 [Planctomycetes bacterium]|nr:hypothetical protein [Planctomycetota bacterium]